MISNIKWVGYLQNVFKIDIVNINVGCCNQGSEMLNHKKKSLFDLDCNVF